jgi:hypothetical protein
MSNFQKFSGLRDKLYHELKTYFDIIDHNEFSDYISNRLNIKSINICPNRNMNFSEK